MFLSYRARSASNMPISFCAKANDFSFGNDGCRQFGKDDGAHRLVNAYYRERIGHDLPADAALEDQGSRRFVHIVA